MVICNIGLYDTRIALIIVYAAINMPFVIWTMLSFYEGISTILDGCEVFIHINNGYHIGRHLKGLSGLS